MVDGRHTGKHSGKSDKGNSKSSKASGGGYKPGKKAELGNIEKSEGQLKAERKDAKRDKKEFPCDYHWEEYKAGRYLPEGCNHTTDECTKKPPDYGKKSKSSGKASGKSGDKKVRWSNLAFAAEVVKDDSDGSYDGDCDCDDSVVSSDDYGHISSIAVQNFTHSHFSGATYREFCGQIDDLLYCLADFTLQSNSNFLGFMRSASVEIVLATLSEAAEIMHIRRDTFEMLVEYFYERPAEALFRLETALVLLKSQFPTKSHCHVAFNAAQAGSNSDI
jgi:hypothetical protein